jgi:competence protein ComEA
MSWKDQFAFSKRQRNGIMVLLALIVCALIILIITDFLSPSPATVDYSSFRADMAKVKFKPADTSKNITAKQEEIQLVRNAKIPTTPIEINSADSADFMNFPLMTAKVARTIIRFRDALGGYYSKKQLLEVYGMDSACYNSMADKLTVDLSKVDKLNVNKATEKALTHHPYLHKKLAKAIIDYRKENGDFKSVRDLLKIDGIDEELFAKLSPYITIVN